MVKNESKFLDRCLQALTPLTAALRPELIIVDTGSTDNTVEIAKKYTDKVYYHPWHNDFAEIRNITLDYAKGEWGLMVDGDEILENAQAIIGFLASDNSEKYSTGLLSVRNIADEKDQMNTPTFLSPRLFRISKDFRFEGAIHEQSCPKAPYIIISSTLVHYGYLSTDKELMEKKFQRNGSILKAELKKDPQNIYYWYNLSLTYWMHLDHELAVEPALKAYHLVKEKHTEWSPFVYVYLQLIKAYINTNQYKAAEAICDEALKITKEDIDLFFFAGRIKFLAGKKEESLELYQNYLSLLEFYRNAAVLNYTVGRYEEVYRDLAAIHAEREEYDTAYGYCGKIKHREQKQELLGSAAHIFLKMNKLDELKKYYEPMIEAEDHIMTNHEEEAFLRYLYKGKAIKNKDSMEYIRYLENAATELPSAKGIEIIRQELENERNLDKAAIQTTMNAGADIAKGTNDAAAADENTEMQQLKRQFKDHIQLLIENQKTREAWDLIRQYEQITPDDIEMAYLKERIS